jgi:hypothetical protein
MPLFRWAVSPCRVRGVQPAAGRAAGDDGAARYGWEAPEPNPYFLTRLNARLDEEREIAPVVWPMSWLRRLRARLVYGSRLTLRPVAAMAMTVVFWWAAAPILA